MKRMEKQREELMAWRQFAEGTWREYPTLEYGKGWDDPDS